MLFATPSIEDVAKGSEKKGTTKTRRHKVFSGPAQATPGRQKRLPLCLGVFVVQRYFAFCDSLHRGDDGRLGGLTFYDSLMSTLRMAICRDR